MQDNSTIRIIIVSAHVRCRPQQGAATCYSSSSAPASAALRLVAVRCAATPRTPCAVTWGVGRGSGEGQIRASGKWERGGRGLATRAVVAAAAGGAAGAAGAERAARAAGAACPGSM